MADCFMLKTTFKKQKRSMRNLVFYAFSMGGTFPLIHQFIYPIIEWKALHILTNFFFVASLVLWLCAWFKNPGHLERDEGFDFLELLEVFEPNCLCPDCEVIRTPRSRHCNICN